MHKKSENARENINEVQNFVDLITNFDVDTSVQTVCVRVATLKTRKNSRP